MVEEATKLGELLKLPDLEPETIQLINAKIREMIGQVKPMGPELQQKLTNIMDEWLNGDRKEGG